MAFFFKGSDNFVGNSLNKTWEQLISNKHFGAAVKGSSGPLPVLTTYPTTDASKVGQKFIYKGVEWSYMSKAEIDALGWPVSKGFPAPVQKNYNPFLLTDSDEYIRGDSIVITAKPTYEPSMNVIIDFLGLGDPTRFNTVILFGSSYNQFTITEFKNTNLLTNLKSTSGTSDSIFLVATGLTDTVINQFFTDLPSTSNTVIIDIRSNPGTATCDPTIATAKGYTVKV